MAPLRGWAPRGQRLIAKVPLWPLEHHDLCRRLVARSDRSTMAARWPSAPAILETHDTGAPDIIRPQDYRPINRRKLTPAATIEIHAPQISVTVVPLSGTTPNTSATRAAPVVCPNRRAAACIPEAPPVR